MDRRGLERVLLTALGHYRGAVMGGGGLVFRDGGRGEGRAGGLGGSDGKPRSPLPERVRHRTGGQGARRCSAWET